jgi:hypothetical protein
VLARVRQRKRNRRAPFCNPGLPAWAKLCRGYAAKRTDLQSWFHNSRHSRASHTSRRFFRFLPQPLRVPRPSPRLWREGWDGFELQSESKKLRKENFKLEMEI